MTDREPRLPPRARRLFRLALRRASLAEREVDDEIAAHLAEGEDWYLARGFTPDAARREALRRFGPMDEARAGLHATARRREARLTLRERWESTAHDLWWSLRQVRRSPGLSLAVIATFAIGIGANATMFGILDQLLLRPPPHVENAHELYQPETTFRLRSGEVVGSSSSYPQYLDIRDHVPAFSGVAMATGARPVSLGVGPDAVAIQNQLVSGNYFDVLRASVERGRALGPQDDIRPRGSPVVVIGWGLWQRVFGGREDIVGQEIRLASHAFQIVGVARRGFRGTGSRAVDVWIPVSAGSGIRFKEDGWDTDRNSTWMTLIGRLRPDVSVGVAEEQVTRAIWEGRAAGGLKVDSTRRARLTPLLPLRQARLTKEQRVAVLLSGVSALVLLIACANIANLLLVRALRRRREIAIRLALGISRARLIRQLTTESLLLALLGSLGALLLVRWGSDILQVTLLSDFAWADSPLDLRLLLFTTGGAVLAGLLAGLLPAVQAGRAQLSGVIGDGARGSSARTPWRSVLLATQSAIATVLLVGTLWFVGSMRRAEAVDAGVAMDELLVGSMDLASVGLDSSAAQQYHELAREQVAAIPGVVDVSVAEAAPFTNWSYGVSVRTASGDSLPRDVDGPYHHVVDDRYMAVTGTRLLAGRSFTGADTRQGSEPVALVNEALARMLFPGGDAVGQCVRLVAGRGDSLEACSRVIGVAANTMRQNVTAGETPVQIYRPWPARGSLPAASALLIRAHGDVNALVPAVRRVMQAVRPGLPSANVRTMRSTVEMELRPWRTGAMMFTVFGSIAIVLAALGLYSVLAFAIAQRQQEMGLRLALGATRADVVRLVVAEGMLAPLAGLLVGVTVAYTAAPFVQPMLFSTDARALATYLGVALAVALVSLLACLSPARRATITDPIIAMRSD